MHALTHAHAVCRLASAPVVTVVERKQRDKKQQDWQDKKQQDWRQEQQQQHHAQEPELPNAGRRAKEPANDETQVRGGWCWAWLRQPSSDSLYAVQLCFVALCVG